MYDINIVNLSLSYGDNLVLDNFNCYIEEGQKVVLAGESGRGKSSLLSAVMGFIKPQCGEIFIAGQIISDANIVDIRRRIAWVPQDSALPFDTIKQWRETLFGLCANRPNMPSINDTVETFNRLGLHETTLNKKTSELSGGERQRVMIAFALLLKKPFLLIDEPTSALDKVSAAKLVTTLQQLNGITMLAVSHDDCFINAFDSIINI